MPLSKQADVRHSLSTRLWIANDTMTDFIDARLSLDIKYEQPMRYEPYQTQVRGNFTTHYELLRQTA